MIGFGGGRFYLFAMNRFLPVVLVFALNSVAWGQAAAPASTPAAPAKPKVPPPSALTPDGRNAAAVPAAVPHGLAQFQANMAAVKLVPQVNLIFDGDSITYRWKTAGKAVWDQNYAPLGAFDFGIGGDRTEHVLWRLEHGQVDGLHPKLILLMIGTNNTHVWSAEQIAEGIKAILDDYRKRCPDAVILLQAIFPRAALPTDPARAKIKATNAIISHYADGKHVLYLDFGAKFLQPDGTLSREIMPDYLHPSVKGYQIWVEAIRPVIDRFFPKGK